MRLEGLETKPVESASTTISADKKIKKKAKAPAKTTTVRTANELRAEKTKKLLFSAIGSLSRTKKSEIINARYPKNECRKAIGEIVSKDSIAKYWNEIETALAG
jgi:thiamine pyrophosphokinase